MYQKKVRSNKNYKFPLVMKIAQSSVFYVICNTSSRTLTFRLLAQDQTGVPLTFSEGGQFVFACRQDILNLSSLQQKLSSRWSN